MQNKNNETGRSMVEMLGVLGIMGVLSVVGVAGYRHATDKNRANNIFGTVSMMAVSTSQQLILGNNATSNERTEEIDGYTFKTKMNYDGKSDRFSITVNNISNRICNQIKNSGYKMSLLTLINGKQAGDCQSELNTVEFVFLDNLNQGSEKDRTSCTTNNDCAPFLGSGYKCNATKGICEIQCASDRTYVENYGCCPNDQLWNGGCCQAANGTKIQEIEGIKMCCQAGNNCCPEGQIYDGKTGSCIDCADVTDTIYNGYFGGCSMCPNLVQVSKWQCAPACTDPDAVLVNGVCRCPLDRPLMRGDWTDSNPQCLPCDYNGGLADNSAYGNIHTGYYCNRRNGSGGSYYCAPRTVGVSWGQTIILKDGTVYKETGSSGSCKPCSEVDVSALEYQASCESCGGTWVGDSWDNGTCQP
jgi:Tfp pilus assembly protein PilE